jgi:dTDP-L-rhamnose 4-epimerase
MGKQILITGGAGFIGAHVANELLKYGYRVRALDNLSPQVHGPERRRPDYLSRDVELIVGDIRDSGAVARALDGAEAVVHLVALVGVGQSMYQIEDYTSVNNFGTAVLWQAIIGAQRRIECVLVASSMSVYGEGLYRDEDGEIREATDRTLEQLRLGDWEIRDEQGRLLTPVPTPESKRPRSPRFMRYRNTIRSGCV